MYNFILKILSWFGLTGSTLPVQNDKEKSQEDDQMEFMHLSLKQREQLGIQPKF